MNVDRSQIDERKLSATPRARTCHICGRLYGLHSFGIHIKQCKGLWIAREALKEKSERKLLPPDPTDGLQNYDPAGLANISNIDLAEINRLASEIYNTVALGVCQHCGRSFLTEKLLVHNKSCTAQNPGRPVNKPSLTSGAKVLEPIHKPIVSLVDESLESVYKPHVSPAAKPLETLYRPTVSSATKSMGSIIPPAIQSRPKWSSPQPKLVTKSKSERDVCNVRKATHPGANDELKSNGTEGKSIPRGVQGEGAVKGKGHHPELLHNQESDAEMKSSGVHVSGMEERVARLADTISEMNTVIAELKLQQVEKRNDRLQEGKKSNRQLQEKIERQQKEKKRAEIKLEQRAACCSVS